MQANREYLMQLNVSEEIAQYINAEMLSSPQMSSRAALVSENSLLKTLPIVLMYNLDKERLEEALRKKLILRIVDY